MTAPRRLQLRRGNTTSISTYVGAPGELIINTDNSTLYVHDGRTAGGQAATVNTASILTAVASAEANIILANVGMRGYVDLGNTIQVAAILSANLGIKGYVDLGNTIQSEQLSAANIGMKGYVDNSVSTANIGIIGYISLGNTIQGAAISAANVGIIGYIDRANTIQSAQLTAANTAWTANASAQQSLIANLQASAYSNVNVASYLSSVGIGSSYSNVNTAAYLGANYYLTSNTANLSLYAWNANITSGGSNYSNVNTAAYLGANYYITSNTANLSTYAWASNVTTANAGIKGYVDLANTIQSAQLTSANLGIIGYIDQANSIQSAQVGAANLAITAANVGLKGYVDFANTVMKAYVDGQIVAANANVSSSGGSNYSNVNVAAYLAGSIATGNISPATTTGSVGSLVFNGSNWLSFTPGVTIGSGAYTVEGWVYFTSANLPGVMLSTLTPGNSGFTLLINSATEIRIDRNGVASDAYAFPTMANNTWHHIAATRDSSGNQTIFVNGSRSTTGATTNNGNFSGNSAGVGKFNEGGQWWLTGSVTQLRAVVGSNVYDPTQTTITVPTTALTAVANTTLLLGVNSAGTYITDSSSTQTVTNNGTVSFSSNGPSVTYSSASTNSAISGFSNISVAGNVTATYFVGNGAFLTGIASSGSNYSNVQVATYLPTYSGNIAANISKAGYTWTFGTGGTTQFPNSLILAPASQSITMQSDQYSQLMWENANLTVAPNMAINSNFYVAQNNATLDIGYRDGSGTQLIKSWYWNVDGNLTLPSGGYILNSDNSIYGAGSSYSNVNVATYLPTYSGNVANIRLGTSGVLTFADGTTQITAGGGSYSNVNVSTFLAGSSTVFVGNVGNVATVYPLQSNITQMFIGGNTVITSGNASNPNATFLMYNGYFSSNGEIRVRNTTTGMGYLAIEASGFTLAGYTGPATANTLQARNIFLTMNGSIGAVFSGIVSSPGVTSTGTVAVNAATGITTNQATFLLANASATTINMGGAATTIRMGTINSNVFVGDAIGNSNKELTLRAQGNWNIATNINSNGGFNSPPYANQLVIGGSGTGMTANYSASGGYITILTIYNPGTGYRNGDVLSVPGGIAGNTFTLTNYSSTLTGNSAAAYTFGIEGNLIVPGNVTARNFIGSGALLTTLPGYAYGNVNVKAYTESMGFQNYGNVNVKAYTESMGFQNYGNVNVTAYLAGNITVGNIVGAQPNVIIQSGAFNWTFNTTGNLVIPTAGTIVYANGNLFSSGGGSYSNVQVATYLPTYQGNIVAANVWTTGNATGSGALTVGPAGYTALPTTIAQFTGNANTYTQLNLQNISTGSDATSEYVATANNGTDTTFFVDIGIANSNYDVNSPNNSLGTTIFPNDSYLYAQGNLATTTGGNLAIGTSTANKTVKIFAGGINSANIVATVSNTGVAVTGNLSTTGNITSSGYIVTAGGFGNISQVDYITANNVVATANLTVGGYSIVSKASFIGALNNAVTVDNIVAKWSSATPSQFQIYTLSGNAVSHWNTQTSLNGTFAVASSSGTLTTSPTNFGGTAGTSGDMVTVVLTNTTVSRAYRIIGHLGASYANNAVIVERIV
jgi:hypothetical protein